MDAIGTAHLTSDILAQRAVAASVSRRQITDVLHEPDGAPELVLDLVAADRGEHATISMTWSREDVERLLEAASGDDVVLVFDRDQLAGALGDVEAHGLRAGAAVFAVAVAGALGSGASLANATVAEGGSGGAAATPITATSTDAASAALGARSAAMNEEYGLGSAGEAAAAEALAARSAALNQEYGLGPAADALAARSAAMNEEYGLGSAGDAAAAEALGARSEAMNQEYGLGPATDALGARSEALNQEYNLGSAGDAAAAEALGARSQALNQEYNLGSAAIEPSSGSTLEAPGASDALLIGGLLLTIAGATFAVRRTAGGRPA